MPSTLASPCPNSNSVRKKVFDICLSLGRYDIDHKQGNFMDYSTKRKQPKYFDYSV